MNPVGTQFSPEHLPNSSRTFTNHKWAASHDPDSKALTTGQGFPTDPHQVLGGVDHFTVAAGTDQSPQLRTPQTHDLPVP